MTARRIVLALGLATLGACARMEIAGDCSYKREVTTLYQCEPDGKLEHWRIIPEQP